MKEAAVEATTVEGKSDTQRSDTQQSAEVVVACVQQRLRIYANLAEYRIDLQRFLRIAQHKHAQLVIFPELAGIMLAPPSLRTQRLTMLKYADRSTRRRTSWPQRTVGRVARWGASFLQLDLFDEVVPWFGVLQSWQQYCDLFGGLAREFQVTLVAPSAYLPSPTDQVIRNISGVFGESGELLGHQAKVILHEQDQAFAQPGVDWQTIQTKVGVLGLLLGNDVLFPEVSRLLAYQGAEILIAQGACRDMALYYQLRTALQAQVQDLQLFAAVSFLVGQTTFKARADDLFVGKSAILAPQALTPRSNGVLVEMGSPRSEGVLSANWQFTLLKEVWGMSEPPMRKEFPLKQIGAVIANLYARLQAKSSVDAQPTPPLAKAQDEAKTQFLSQREAILYLDDLPITNTITRRWPLAKLEYPSPSRPESTTDMPLLFQSPLTQSSHQAVEVIRPEPENFTLSSLAEDETEEMDALPGDAPEA